MKCLCVSCILPGEGYPGRFQSGMREGKGVFGRGPILHTSAVIGAGPLTPRQ